MKADLRDCMVEATVRHVGIELFHCLMELHRWGNKSHDTHMTCSVQYYMARLAGRIIPPLRNVWSDI